jgi:hypothetical protein
MKTAIAVMALVLVACATAAAAPGPSPPARRADACRTTGKVIFQIDLRVEPGAKAPTSTTKVFASGGWTRDEADAEGKAAAQRTGCLAKADVKQIEALAGAPWKVSKAQFHCMAVSSSFTVYQVDGKTVFTDKLCNSEALDDKSRARLDAAIKLVDGAVKAAQ